MQDKQLVKKIIDLAFAKKALDLSCFDVSKKSDLCDFQIICSGQTERQTKAICDEIVSYFKKELQIVPQAVEGLSSSHWILIDYGFCFIHIFTEEQRQYYALDSLWQNSKVSENFFDD